MGAAMDKKKRGSFLKICITLAGLWILTAGAVTVIFQALGNPLDAAVVAILFSPGVGEFGFGALIQLAKEKSEAEDAREEAEALKAEAEELRARLEAIQSRMSNAEDIAKQSLAETKKMKAERDAAKKEAAQLKDRLTPFEDIIRQNISQSSAATNDAD